MPRVAKELSAAEVRRLVQAGSHAVGGVSGLQLQVQDSGSRSWVLRVLVGGKRRHLGLGPFPEVSLANARDEARRFKDSIRKGVDPVSERQAAKQALRDGHAKSVTFQEATRRYLALKRKEFRNAKHAKQWEATLNTYANPVIGGTPVADIGLADVLSVIEPIWVTKTETAKRVRGRIESVLNWASVRGHRMGDNPARWQGNLDAILPRPSKIARVKHHRALPWSDVPSFMVDLRQKDGIAARALEFLILTAARSGEVRGAAWTEVDLDGKVWTIPARRMKAGRQHVVPLADSTIELLKALPRMQDNALVFPAPRGGVLSDMTLAAVLKRMAVDAVPHGFRSSFRDWCAESTNFPREVAEQALAHVNKDKVEAAYQRGDLLVKRSKLMEAWAGFCAQPRAGGAISLRARK